MFEESLIFETLLAGELYCALTGVYIKIFNNLINTNLFFQQGIIPLNSFKSYQNSIKTFIAIRSKIKKN